MTALQFIATAIVSVIATLLTKRLWRCATRNKEATTEVVHTQAENMAKTEEKPTYITLGSSKKTVLAVLGTPKNVVGETWFYIAGYVDFSCNRVKYVHAYSHERNMCFRIDPETLI